MASGCIALNGLTETEEREITRWVLQSVAAEPEKWQIRSSPSYKTTEHVCGLGFYIDFDSMRPGGYVSGANPPTARFKFYEVEERRVFFGLIRRRRKVYNGHRITDAFHELRHNTDGEAIKQFRDIAAPKFAAVEEIKRSLAQA